MSEITAELDARGLRCPLPVLKTRKRLSGLAPGDRLVVTADDPAAVIDMPHFCNEQGHTLEDWREEPDGSLVFELRKGGIDGDG
ncbi:MAG: sulfurtransferase TusA family protein [Rhodobacteraceae bacterium]|nr:sulfurtransferase TusA family protein [Paracoccaceae bacterium]